MPFFKNAALTLLLLSAALASARAAETPLPAAIAAPGQAIVLAVTGFASGAVLSFFADRYIAAHSMLPVHVSLASSLVVCILTLIMCTVAGSIAVKRAAVADPAALY